MKIFVIRTQVQVSSAVAFLEANWKGMAKTKHPLVVEFHPESIKRNTRQNKLYWTILRQIEEQAWIEGRQYSSEVWHEAAKRRFIGCVELPGGGTMAMSSAKLSTNEFADYITKVEVFAQQELGVCLTENIEPQGYAR